ncbi:MAG: LptF/LptG family permease [Elusimicrobiota bacterium]
MPLLQRYIIRQFLPVFGAGLALFLGVLLMNQFLRLFATAMLKGLPFLWIMTCFSRLLPSFATLAVPMAFLVAVMVTLGHLTDKGEVMALRSAGFSFHEIARPFLWMALALSLLMLVVNHKVGPDGFRSFKRRTSEAAQKIAKIDLRPRTFTPIGPWRLYARDVVPSTGRLEGVYLVRPNRQESLRINARAGVITLDPGRGVDLELIDGQLVLPNKEPERFTSGRFERYRVHLPLEAPLVPRELDMQEMSTGALREKAGRPDLLEEKRLEYLVEISARSAAALSPFVFFWVATPLGLGLRRRARGADFVASLVVMFVFYGLLVVGVSLGRRHASLASVAPWLANAVGLAVGAWLTRMAASQ